MLSKEGVLTSRLPNRPTLWSCHRWFPSVRTLELRTAWLRRRCDVWMGGGWRQFPVNVVVILLSTSQFIPNVLVGQVGSACALYPFLKVPGSNRGPYTESPCLRYSWFFQVPSGRLRLKCDGTRADTRFRLSAKRTSPFKSAGASVQSTTGSRGMLISGSNAGYTMFRGSVKSTGYPLHSPVSPSLPLPRVTVCHHISTGV